MFAALFFLFFGLQVNTGRLPSVALPVAALVARDGRHQVGDRMARRGAGRRGAGGRRAPRTALLPHGDIAVVLAGLAAAAGIEPDLPPVAAAYVLVMAIAGALLMRWPGALLRAAAWTARGGPPPSQRAATAGRT